MNEGHHEDSISTHSSSFTWKSVLRAGVGVVTEFGPLIAFIIISRFSSFVTATIVLVIVTTIVLGATWAFQRRIALFPIVSSGSVILFGLGTIISGNSDLIIAKDTLFYGAFGSAILGGLIAKRLVLKKMFSRMLAITDKAWRIISLRWGILFIGIAIGNEIISTSFSDMVWISYKVNVIYMIALFVVWQFPLVYRERLSQVQGLGLSFKRFK